MDHVLQEVDFLMVAAEDRGLFLSPASKPSSNDDRASRDAGGEDMPGRNPGLETCGIACMMSCICVDLT